MNVRQGVTVFFGKDWLDLPRAFGRIAPLILFLLCFSVQSGWSLNISSQPDPGVWGFNGIVYSICRAGNVVYVGGNFTGLISPDGNQTIPASNLAALDAETGQPLPWRPSADDSVFAVAASADESEVYVGGLFTQIDGIPRSHFAAISPGGALLWTADAVSTVKTMIVAGDTIYLGGNFTKIAGEIRLRLAAIRPPNPGSTVARVLPWAPNVTAVSHTPAVNAMAIANGKVLVAGDFTHANGEPSLDQAIFDAFTGQFRPMQTNLDFTALSAATDGNNFYVGFAGSGGGRVAAWDTSGKLLWKSGCNGDVQAITYASSRVIPGGHYTKILGTWINRLVALTTTKGTLDTSWNPDPNSGGDRGVWALTVTDKLYAGGAFEQMGTNQARGFAQFSIVDAAAPSTPSNLVATVSTASQVDLVWAASTDDVAVTAYEIYRNGEFLAATSRVNLFSDDTALPLSGYTYQVRARDGVGNVSGLSDEAFATTPGDAAPPTTPRNLAALAVSSTRVDLTWEESSDDSFVAGYDIYRKGLLLTNVGPGSAFSDLSVKPSRFYNYQIVARDGSGNVSGFSNKATVSTSGDTEPPTAPSSLAANAVNSTQIGLSWAPSIDNVGVTAYQVFRDGGLLATLGIATNYLDKTVSPLNTYQYEVRGRDAAGNLSDPSIPAVASTPADTQPPSAPKGLIAAASSPTTIQLTWKSSTDNVAVIGYDILRQGLVIASVGIETNYADTSVSPSTTYNYRVRAFDAAGNSSPQSAKFTVTTPPVDSNAPSAPTALTANPLSATEIDLTWNPATDDVAVVAYDIYRDGILLASVGTATNFSDTTALPQTTYSYQLTASDAAQNVSAASDPAMATTPADTDAPTAPAGLTASAVSSTEIDLQWNASTDNVGVSAYDIYRNNVFLTSIGPISSYSDTSVNDMESYSYQVIARDEAGNMSDPSNATDPLTP